MLMTTAENQAMADLRLPILLQIPGVMHGVSVEPTLGRADLEEWLWPGCRLTKAEHDQECGGGEWCDAMNLDWVICGGETGHHTRPMHPDWVRNARDQAVGAGVPFFFKGWGEWLPLNQGKLPITKNYHGAKTKSNWYWHPGNPSEASIRVGKKAAGRLLDGRTWDEVPHGL